MITTENNLAQALLKLEQYNTTSSNLQKDLEENNKYLNKQELTISILNSELNKLYIDIHIKSNQIDAENKQLDIAKKRQKASQMIVLL